MTHEKPPIAGSTSSTPLDRRGSSRGPDRRFHSQGEYWRVAEHHDLLGSDVVRSLVFESENAVRRVRNFPDDWLTLSDAALLALSWQR